jgi:hypothetical protein
VATRRITLFACHARNSSVQRRGTLAASGRGCPKILASQQRSPNSMDVYWAKWWIRPSVAARNPLKTNSENRVEVGVTFDPRAGAGREEVRLTSAALLRS